MRAFTRQESARRALTLLELVVVLAILAAVAAIVVPLLPNLLRRAHKATDATQTAELSKAIQLYQALYVSYPDNYDMLTDGTAVPSYIPNDGGLPFGGFVTAAPLTVDEMKALVRVGVIRVQKLAPNTTGANFHPTMYPYAGTIITDALDLSSSTVQGAAATTNFAVLSIANAQAANPAFMQAEFNSEDATAKYVVFGVGPRTSIVGKGIQDAPTSVPQNKQFTPDTLYSRVGVIFKVNGIEVSRTERARFICAVALEDDELESTEKDIIGYYEVARGTD